MNNAAIRVEKLSKQYHIGSVRRERYHTFRESLINTVRAPFRRAGSLLRGHAAGAGDLHETLWAVKDVSFAVKPGETVGLIGRNGAGKSTLLKILSRITEPTSGWADIYGRVGSLLEVGTGFHPELTGRENTFLNGAILGMGRREIERKFDEIVAFSEVEKFIDTPLKHYSSGMRLRLAFAVAAHLEPEILIIDEVLAVGDAAFQRKCMNKMQDVGQQGRTILFVSHSMPAITRLCERVILLDAGEIVQDGPSHEVTSAYLNSGLGTTGAREWTNPVRAPGDAVIRLRAVTVCTLADEVIEAVDVREPVILQARYEITQPGQVFMLYFRLFNEEGIEIFCTIDSDETWRSRPRPVGQYTSRVVIPANFLAEGTIFVTVAAKTLNPMINRFHARDVVAFMVYDRSDGDSARMDYGGDLGGVVRPLLPWTTVFHSLNGEERGMLERNGAPHVA
jgi:lipopolysaccharide transport system ATP-binding protein